jgi:hypothetical protein
MGNPSVPPIARFVPLTLIGPCHVFPHDQNVDVRHVLRLEATDVLQLAATDDWV